MRHETCYYLRRSQNPDKKENVDHIYDLWPDGFIETY